MGQLIDHKVINKFKYVSLPIKARADRFPYKKGNRPAWMGASEG